jgi:phosphoenolpyruvate carboxykinase (GTP)
LKQLLNPDQLKASCRRSLATSSILPPKVEQYVLEKAKVCQPDSIHVCNGSEAENDALLRQMQKDGQVVAVKGKYKNW